MPAAGRIFVSYSHQGKGSEWKDKLLRALHVFERHHLLDVWQDGKIRASAFWDDDIKQAMSNARLAVVLLTKEALESEYIFKTEFPFLRERQQHHKLPIFPVVCEECDWKAHDWLRAHGQFMKSFGSWVDGHEGSGWHSDDVRRSSRRKSRWWFGAGACPGGCASA